MDIEHIDTIIDMRRYQVLMESEFPTEAGLMLRNVENQGDPWGLGGAKRTDWIESLDFEVPVITGTIPDDVEYLYWVGCAGALDERARKGAQATARMLHRAGVSFGILGPKESCTGDPVRRLGNEYLYQEQAMKNIETLTDAGVKKVIATCPHCFNSLANEYPALGGNFEVIHHSQLLDHLVQAGRLTPGGGYAGSVTYHDPCYLGRHNRVFDEPRSVIDAIPGAKQIEMKRCRERGFCCGAGGARMWLEENIGTRVNMDRTAEAIGTGADVVSTACPYCMIMLDDAVRANAKEDDVRVLDLSQLLEESMGEPVAVGARRRRPAPSRAPVEEPSDRRVTPAGAAPVAGRVPGRVTQPNALASASRSRVASATSSLRAMVGTDSSSPLNWRWDMTSTSMSVSDTTEAERGRRSSRASSPKWLPAPRVATFRPFRVTAAVPSTMMKNSWPMWPSSTRTLPGGHRPARPATSGSCGARSPSSPRRARWT